MSTASSPGGCETFKFSTDPELVAKVTDIVSPTGPARERDRALRPGGVTRTPALDRAAPTLPMQIGISEPQTHDYVRHGTTTLFVASDIATGKVTALCKLRHRHQEFLALLKQV